MLTVERKSLDDLVTCLFSDWERFRKELQKLRLFSAKIIVVEGGIEDVYNHHYISQALPQAALGRCLAIEHDYCVPVQFCGSRPMARWVCERFLLLHGERFNGIIDERFRDV